MGECSCRWELLLTNSWGLLAKFGHSVPLYFGAFITLLNVLYGMKYMPESLDKNNRLKEITFVRLNPFAQLAKYTFHEKFKMVTYLSVLLGYLTDLYKQFSRNLQ